MKLKDLKVGTWFTRNNINHPRESQVYVRDRYLGLGYILVHHWNDINNELLLNAETEVYTDFIF